ncbi:hypothetical protein LWI29_015628 [Acer saccharum]|uniref:Uncharacterized protein n=1 Tax=Acer saccharum TaxID=4024 RepID=A0AA39SJS8_ACESA|nr:hypothetical protein LWI29_015628 [Acer saccharum]
MLEDDGFDLGLGDGVGGDGAGFDGGGGDGVSDGLFMKIQEMDLDSFNHGNESTTGNTIMAENRDTKYRG